MPSLPEHLVAALADRYRIEREIGAGGMATVYLAHDVRHARPVALKVLKPELSAVVGAERFLAEIRTTANLQHPHILSLFDSGAVDGAVFYVMPFVDGESLRDRLDRERQLPVHEAVLIATEVADALQYAHSHGVIHRDIKPENILLQGGHALVADFGIALAASNTAGGRITETGMSLGTPAYMSPEQAMGERTLDARTDVYALGCVLYEMLVGEPPFTGATAQQVVARVMTEEPRSLTAQRKTVSPSVDAAVAAALSKLPADRPASAAAFAAMLSDSSATLGRPLARSGSGARTRVSPLTAALGVALLVLGGLAARGWMRSTPEPPVTRNFLRFAPGEEPLAGAFGFTLLPDGSALVYVGRSASGTQLWIKKRSALHATPLSGTIGARSAFASPDGKWIGFLANSSVRKVPVSGGDPVTLASAECYGVACDESFAGSGAWLDDGHLVFRSANALMMVSENGGAADTLVTSRMAGGLSPVFPYAMPGSRGLLFTSCTLSCNKSRAWVIDLPSRKAHQVAENAAFVQYVETGQLMYADAGGTVHAVPFDAKTLQVTGKESSVLEHVAGNISVAHDGTVAYLDGDPSPMSSLAIVNRDGAERQVDSTWRGNFATLALSPDGRQFIVSMLTRADEEHLWLVDIAGRQERRRLTLGAAQNTTPTFSADGQSVLMSRFMGDSSSFIMQRIDGTSPEVTLQRGKNWVIESTVSRDGRWLVTRGYSAGRGGERSIYAKGIGSNPDTVTRAIVSKSVSNFSPALSPDGKWLLYSNEETGREEIWAVPFPDAHGARWQVSAEGGSEPAWSPDGRTVFYVSPEHKLMSADVNTSTGFSVGAHHTLFSVAPYKRHPTHRAYEVLPGGQHFLMIREGERGAGDIVLVENWFSELRKGGAAKP